jgi:hypothetical protein
LTAEQRAANRLHPLPSTAAALVDRFVT